MANCPSCHREIERERPPAGLPLATTALSVLALAAVALSPAESSVKTYLLLHSLPFVAIAVGLAFDLSRR